MAALRMGPVLSLVSCLCLPLLTLSFHTDDHLQAVLTALDKLVSYYHSNHNDLNLDGLFGLRVIEGQLQLLISEHHAGRHQHLPQDVLHRIIALKSAAQNASKIGVESVRADDSQYFKQFSSMVLYPWIFMKHHRKLEASLRWEISQYREHTKVKLTEELSDRCMTELLKGSGQGCEVSDDCVKIMTTRGLTGYGITHQILWSILGEMMPNCSQALNKVLSRSNRGDVNHFQLELCTNNFYEMVAVVQVLMHGKVHESQQDLFLEQQFVCPNLGFYEFMKKDYLEQILSWQFPSGCFGESNGPQAEEDVDLASLLEGYHDKNINFIPEVRKSNDSTAVKKEGQKQEQDSVVENMRISMDRDNSNHWSTTRAFIEHENGRHNNQKLQGNSILQKKSHSDVASNLSLKLPEVSAVNNPTDQKAFSLNKKNIVQLAEAQIHHEEIKGDRKETAQGVQHVGLTANNQERNPSKTYSRIKTASAGKDQQMAPGVKSLDPSLHKLHQRLVAADELASNLGKDVLSEKKIPTGRRLLVEKEMSGGCLSHKTGVGSGALVMYLRYLIDPGAIDWAGQHELLQSDFRNLLQATGEIQVVSTSEGHTKGDDEEEEEMGEEENGGGNADEGGGTLIEGVSYNDDDNEAEADDDQGDDDYNEEQADNGGVKVAKGNHDVDTVVIHEDADRDTEIYPSNNKILPDAAVGDADTAVDQEEDHNYYDDEGEAERGIIKRRKPPTSRPHPPVKTRRKHSGILASEGHLYGQEAALFVPDHPNYTIILFVSVAPFFILLFFLYKFIRRRRVHIRYYF